MPLKPWFLKTRWTGLQVFALMMLAVGLWGTASELTSLVTNADWHLSTTSNPVVKNEQRRHAALLENQMKDYPGNLAVLVGFSVFILAVTVHFAAVVVRGFSRLPLASLVAGLFLGASGICGLLVLPSVARVNEFAFQAVGAPTGEVEWLRGGMAFLNQLHLFFVAGWLMFLGLGWLALGLGLLRLPGGPRLCGIPILVGGVGILGSLAADYSLPTYGETAPGAVIVLSGVFSVGITVGLIGTGLLSFLLERERARQLQNAASRESEA